MLALSRTFVLGALLALSSCSSDPAADDGSGAGGAASTGGSGSGAGKPARVDCPDGPEPKTNTEPVRVGIVQGQLVDESGAPTSAGLVQVCGKDICINAKVDDSGELYEPVNRDMDAPACKFGDGRTFGKLALPLGAGDTDLGTLTSVSLPGFDEGVPLLPGQTATSAGVSLALASDANVQVDLLTYEKKAEHGFRAAEIPAATLSLFRPGFGPEAGPGFALGFALSPVETRICPSPALSIENSTELAPGSRLELFILGLDVLEEWAPYSGWQKVGEGQVSDDGSTLDFPDGVPLLTAIGIREKR